MAHEICHKLLHIKFKGQTTNENEVFTDLAAIYSGFGRLILNGCHVEWKTTEPFFNGTKTTTHTRDLGYLDIKDYAFAYAMMGSMYGLPLDAHRGGLSTYASEAIRGIVIPSLLPTDFDQEILRAIQEYGDLMRDINLLEDGLKGVKGRIKYKLAKLDYAPDVRSWNGFKKPITAYSLLLEPPLQDEAYKIESLREFLSNKNDIRQLKSIFCPYCGNRVDLPSSLSDARYLDFKCFSCEKTFTVGMNLEDPLQDHSPLASEPKKKKESMFSRLFKKE